MKTKFTKLEKSWILYDIGNSAFILMVSTLIPIYFNYLAGNNGLDSITYLSYWGYAASISTIIVAILGPICGAIADNKNFKKPLFLGALLVGVIGCMTLGVYASWVMFLLVYIVTKVGYSMSIVFYDSMINDVTTEERVDDVSAQGYGWGYIGSCIPFALCLVLVLMYERIGISYQLAMILSFAIVGIWWLAVTLPLLKNYKQVHYVEHGNGVVKKSFVRLGNTLKDIHKDKQVFLFLIAYFFYIDGVYTIIEMATAYGQALGLDTVGLLLALLVTQFVAFPCSIVFGKLSKRIRSEYLIMVCITAYTGITIYALFMQTQAQFWVLAICVGMFQGGIQALSRSYFAKIIPSEKSGEYYGIMDICGKGASFLGTTLVGITAQLTGSANKGVAILAVVFVIGMLAFAGCVRCGEEREELNQPIGDKII